jgi:hypothetical protein
LNVSNVHPVVAYLLATSIAARVHVYHCVKRLRVSELIGGNRIWRTVEVSRVRQEIGAARRIAILTLRSITARQTWTTAYLADVLRKSPRWCTWPIPVPAYDQDTPQSVRAARSVT